MAEVYLIRNLLNGKGYVGVSKFSARKRWKDHVGAANGNSVHVIHRAVPDKSSALFLVLADLEAGYIVEKNVNLGLKKRGLR